MNKFKPGQLVEYRLFDMPQFLALIIATPVDAYSHKEVWYIRLVDISDHKRVTGIGKTGYTLERRNLRLIK